MRPTKPMPFGRLLLVPLLLCVSSMAFATSGGMTSAGAFGLGGPEDTGLREMVELSPVANLLVGRPKNSMVKLIIVSAQQQPDAARIILRELITVNGTKTLAITAPDSLAANIRRLQVFIQPTAQPVGMRRIGPDSPETIEPFRMEVDGMSAETGGTLVGYSIGGPGVFELSHVMLTFESPVAARAIGSGVSDLIGGSYYRGFLPWGAAVVLMLFGWQISRWALRDVGKEAT